jgi:hypothetical protein
VEAQLLSFPRRLMEVLSLMMPLPALAAPFCVETQAVPPQCIYFDANSCNQRAGQLQGICSANPNEVHVIAGLGHYCLLTSGVSMCIFTDRANCEREARRQRGACARAPALPESPAPDPYRDTRPPMAGY